MIRCTRFLFLACLYCQGVFVVVTFASPISDGFDFPVGKPNGDGYDVLGWKFLEFTDQGIYHPGEDWNGIGGEDTDLGNPVYAVSNGVVVGSGEYTGGWGHIILIKHLLPEGTVVWSQYAHLQDRFVSVGNDVVRGQKIGTIGKGEKNKFLAHLHFEIRKVELQVDNWKPDVLDGEVVKAKYHHPTEFINAHRKIALPVPTILITPTIGTVGATKMMLEGSGFTPNGTATSTTTLPNGIVRNFKRNIDGNGRFSVTFVLDQEGTYTSYETDDLTGRRSNTITYTGSALATFNLTLFQGWNMVSVPGNPSNNSIATLVSGKPILPTVYILDPTTLLFKPATTLEFGTGYLIGALQNTTIPTPYQPASSLRYPLKQGWNMIGSVSVSIPINSLRSDPPGALALSALPVYHLKPSLTTITFEKVTTIEPGGGYLIAALSDATLMMNVPAAPEMQTQPAVPQPKPTWESVLEVQTQSQRQELVFGMYPTASAGFDALWDSPLPPIPDWINRVLKASWKIEDNHFPMLSQSVQRISSHAIWHLSLELPGPGEIHWRNLPESYRCTLWYNGQAILMQRQQGITLPSGKHQLILALDAFDTLPKQTQLLPNFPNPFNPETWIPYRLAEDGDVTLVIYDVAGREVRRFHLQQQLAGEYIDKNRAIYWDGKNQLGESVSSGVYFYSLQTAKFSQTRKLTIIR